MQKLINLYRQTERDEMPMMLASRISQGFIKVRPLTFENAPQGRYSLLKYNPATTMFKGHWDAYITQGGRGHIIDENFNPIIMPFPKMFSASELGITVNPNQMVLAFKKRNGYMLDVTWSSKLNQLIVGTTGTIDSDYAKLGRTYIKDWMIPVFQKWEDYTFTFEVCDPSDPHIFPEPQGLYLIGARVVMWNHSYNMLVDSLVCHEMLTDFRVHGNQGDVKFDEPKHALYSEVEEESNTCDHEGFVVWHRPSGSNINLPLKLKGQHYAIRKKLARSKPENLLPLLSNASNPLWNRPEYNTLRECTLGDLKFFASLPEQERLAYLTGVMEEIRYVG